MDDNISNPKYRADILNRFNKESGHVSMLRKPSRTARALEARLGAGREGVVALEDLHLPELLEAPLHRGHHLLAELVLRLRAELAALQELVRHEAAGPVLGPRRGTEGSRPAVQKLLPEHLEMQASK